MCNVPTRILFLLFLISCNSGQERNPVKDSASTMVPPVVTIVAGLPPENKPRVVKTESRPKPLTIPIPQNGGVTKKLPVLKNEKGEAILNAEGHPYILGDAGKSCFTTFTTDNGLALDAVSCSVTDRFGNLWFGTYGGGVSRYDGKSFTSFTTAQGLANNMIWSIIEDRKGNLWFGTYGGGVSRYDGHSFTSITTEHGLANNLVWSILEDSDGILWFGTDGGGVSRYDGVTFTTFDTSRGLPDNKIRSILEDRSVNLWFGTLGGGASRYDGRSFTTFATGSGLAGNHVSCIMEDPAGNLWFGTDGDGVCRYDGRSFKTFTTADGLAKNNVWCSLADKNGTLWFGTYGGGMSRYDGRSFKSFTTEQGLANNSVYCIQEDKAGTLWFGTDGGGVSRYDGRSFTSFTTAQGLANNMVWSIMEDRAGNFWFGTNGGGVSRCDGQSFTSFSTAQGLANNIVFSVLQDRNSNLWFGTNGGGVSRFDGSSFTNFTTGQGLGSNHVRCILEDRSGILWFGTVGGGVSRYDGKSFTSFTSAQGLPNNRIYCIYQDHSGALWFGTYGGGVSRYDNQSFTTFTTDQGLADNMVYCILGDRAGNLWFGTENGLSVMPGGDLPGKDHTALSEKRYTALCSPLFKTFRITEGLPDNFVTNIIQMPDGKLVAGTNLGIVSFTPSPDLSRLSNIEVFNSATGYPVKDVNVGQNCMLLDSKGIIWIGTGSEKSALIRFDHTALKEDPVVPAPVIQNIKVGQEAVCWHNLRSKGRSDNGADSATTLLNEYSAYGKRLTPLQEEMVIRKFGDIRFDNITGFYPLPVNLVLPYEHNRISFNFVAIETSKPFLVYYRYMLEGYDKEWSPVTGQTSANFGNIKEGSYTFLLKARGASGTWSEPTRYTFTVLPPVYRTWWAWLSYSVIFLLTLHLFNRWRERKLRQEKIKLEKIVEERTAVVEKQKMELVRQNIQVEKQKAVVEKEKQRSDELLLNILPGEVAEELKLKGHAEARMFDEVTVLFTDFQDFTRISETMAPTELVEEIHACFMVLDRIIDKYGIEKIKTIGDSYMCAGGLPVVNRTHASDVVGAGLEIQEFIRKRIAEKTAEGKESFHIRIGIHSGPVVAGIVGIRKFAYDIWGDTVNTASRMESSGEAERVNISGTTYELVKDKFHCTYRGKLKVKGKGELDMYFVDGRR